MATSYDPQLSDPTYIGSLYPSYDRLRDEAPVLPVTMPNGQVLWLVFGHENITAVMSDKRIVKDPRNVLSSTDEQERELVPEWMAPLVQTMITSDPPIHTRLRRLAQPAFSPRLLEALRPKIQATADNLIDAALPKGRLEVMGDFAFPFTTAVVSDFLGFPYEDRELLAGWTSVLTQNAVYGDVSAVETQIRAFSSYLQDLFAHKRTHPSDDVISALVQAEERGDQLDERELLGMVFLLIGGGFETTIILITQGTYALLQHRDQFELLRQRPELSKNAVEELLRIGAGGTSSARFAAADIDVAGVTIPQGAEIIVMPASANYDPKRFPNPARLDITREHIRHLSFGHGIHACMGAPLARLEADVAFSTLARRLPTMQVSNEEGAANWEDEFPFLKRLNRLVVTF